MSATTHGGAQAQETAHSSESVPEQTPSRRFISNHRAEQRSNVLKRGSEPQRSPERDHRTPTRCNERRRIRHPTSGLPLSPPTGRRWKRSSIGTNATYTGADHGRDQNPEGSGHHDQSGATFDILGTAQQLHGNLGQSLQQLSCQHAHLRGWGDPAIPDATRKVAS